MEEKSRRLSNAGELDSNDDKTYVIDFDDCGFGWYLHDLASALSFYEHHLKAPEWIAHWIEGYSKVLVLSKYDLDIIPSLIMQRRLQLLAWSGSHSNTALAQSLGKSWTEATYQLCRAYLSSQ